MYASFSLNHWTCSLHRGWKGFCMIRELICESGKQIKIKPWFVNYVFIVTNNGSKKLRGSWIYGNLTRDSRLRPPFQTLSPGSGISSAVIFKSLLFWFLRYVVEPYRKYPNLLEVLLNFLKTEQAPGIRREVLDVILVLRSKYYTWLSVFSPVGWTQVTFLVFCAGH